ncbi:hypothetical protein ACFTWF_30870 [Rhodococcus sp. NPDC056960]|uniref:hypothetical protein n=1 Tax=Rhodococcus sp. NPDC056960 TaxID=3345982 RepID=UPI003635827B
MDWPLSNSLALCGFISGTRHKAHRMLEANAPEEFRGDRTADHQGHPDSGLRPGDPLATETEM